jgi:hypothetical protein
MAGIFISKNVTVKSGLREYTASGTIANPKDYVEMVFTRAVRINQICWKWALEAYWQVWIIDSQGLAQLVDEQASTYKTEYVMNSFDSSIAPRYFDVPVGGKLRVEVRYNDISGGGDTILSCVAESL